MADERERRSRRRQRVQDKRPEVAPVPPLSGKLTPLGAGDIAQIHGASLDILERIGLAMASLGAVDLATGAGAKLSADGRLLFPGALVEDTIAALARPLTLHGQRPGYELELGGTRVYAGSGGTAPNVLDMETGRYRPSTLADLYDAARLVDALPNVQFFSRSLVARDMPDPRSLDINTAFASLAGTAKHVVVSASDAVHVREIAFLCALVAGSEAAFRAAPFLSLNINHVVPPLRFAAEACDVLIAAARAGIPVMVNTFGQMGASSPVTMAGCLAQSNAETLAGMVLARLAAPDVRAVYGARPMVTDLRSGGIAGGSGEQALLTAAASQLAQHYGLANSTIAGATDSKTSDAQAGYEKALSVALAVQAGANLVTQAAGMQAGLTGCSFEAYVIDDDMLGAVMRAARPIEVTDATLSVEAIAETVRGDGHFLGHAETHRRMKSDFLYPSMADRRSLEAWEAAGASDIRELARVRAREILATHYPSHLSADLCASLRDQFDIRLPKAAMCPA